MSINTSIASGIRDNYHRGTTGDFLKQKIHPKSFLRIVSAYFTIYAYDALKSELNAISGLKFLFGEPRFVRSLDPDRTEKKSFTIEEDGLREIDDHVYGLYGLSKDEIRIIEDAG